MQSARDSGRQLSRAYRYLVAGTSMLLPWGLRRRVLEALLGYRLSSTSRIGLAFVAPDRLEMGPGSTIGHLTVCRGPTLLRLGECATIGRLNWISATPASEQEFFSGQATRTPELIVSPHAGITHRHMVDCTDRVEVGAYATMAGWRSQILTHWIDIKTGRQVSRPVRIGAYCFIATNCVLVGGAELPDYSILGANSLLHKRFHASYKLYSGVPAAPCRDLPSSSAYFHRTTGHVI